MRKTGANDDRQFEKLRNRAEGFLDKGSADVKRSKVEDVQGLIQELRVHQIELELQNEELRNAQRELSESRDKYFELYDFAPVGYFTLDEKGLILEVNLAGADLLGSERASLVTKRFSQFVARTAQDTFYLRRKQALETGTRQVFELELKRKNGQSFHAQLQSDAVPGKEGNPTVFRTAVIDITDRKFAEEALLEVQQHLEETVERRTASLVTANAKLEEEVEERRRTGKALKESRQELHLLASRLLSIQEDDRRVIALDLHDTIAQTLSAIKMFVEAKVNPTDDPLPDISLERISVMVGGCIVELRRIIDHLRPSILDDLGIVTAVNRHCLEFERLNRGIRVERDITIKEDVIPDESKIVIYRIMQETLNNISKHSRAKTVNISLHEKAGRIEFRIRDDGIGFDESDTGSGGSGYGIGINSMKERVYLSQGSFSIQSRKGEGTEVVSSWGPRKPTAEVIND